MLTKLILIGFLIYLANKVLILPLKKEFLKFFQNATDENDTNNTQTNSPSEPPLILEEDIEDAEFKEIDE